HAALVGRARRPAERGKVELDQRAGRLRAFDRVRSTGHDARCGHGGNGAGRVAYSLERHGRTTRGDGRTGILRHGARSRSFVGGGRPSARHRHQSATAARRSAITGRLARCSGGRSQVGLAGRVGFFVAEERHSRLVTRTDRLERTVDRDCAAAGSGASAQQCGRAAVGAANRTAPGRANILVPRTFRFAENNATSHLHIDNADSTVAALSKSGESKTLLRLSTDSPPPISPPRRPSPPSTRASELIATLPPPLESGLTNANPIQWTTSGKN